VALVIAGITNVTNEQIFRWLFIALCAATFFISGYFRQKARKSSVVIPRAYEGLTCMLLRALFAVPLFLSICAYMINPDWMDWSALPLPAWLRYSGALVGFGMLLVLYWVVLTLGKNISETFLTKEGHRLVTRGPYAVVRHPLYSVGTIIFGALGLLAANWMIIAMVIISIIAIALLVIPREESHLLKKFGGDYRDYIERTGMLAPRLNLFG
jgi:protein-S-isoprenylcysteine O-methyltransferase Ste14